MRKLLPFLILIVLIGTSLAQEKKNVDIYCGKKYLSDYYLEKVKELGITKCEDIKPEHLKGKIAYLKLQISRTESRQPFIIDEHYFDGARTLEVLKIWTEQPVKVSRKALAKIKNLRKLILVGNINSQNFINLISSMPLKESLQDLEFSKDSGFKGDQIAQGRNFLNAEPIVFSPNLFHGFKKLQKIEFRNLKIEKIHPWQFYNLSKLKSVDISVGFMREIPKNSFVNLPELDSVLFESNLIDRIHPSSFIGTPKMRILSLKGNRLASLNENLPIGLSSLEALYLHGNSLKKIEADAFSMFPQLQSLHLADNFIGELSDGAFAVNTKLDVLNLQDNQLTRFPSRQVLPVQKIRINVMRNKFDFLNKDELKGYQLKLLQFSAQGTHDRKGRPLSGKADKVASEWYTSEYLGLNDDARVIPIVD